MRCLCCNKELEKNENLWHKSCIKKFFGCEEFPKISLSEYDLKKLVDNSIDNGFTVQGIQKKISLGFAKDNNKRLTLSNYPVGYILKPDSNEYPEIAVFEYVTMTLANIVKLPTVPFGLIKLNDKYAYITKRVDRFIKNKKVILAQEDFCQLQNKLTEDKYKGSYEKVSKTIEEYSSNKEIDKVYLFNSIIFSFIVGNSDMHLKNFSLLETFEGSNTYKLAPFYDLLCVNLLLPNDKEELALTLNEKKKNITKNDFLKFGESIGISKKICINLINKMISYKSLMEETIDESPLTDESKVKFKELINERIERLS